MNCPLTKLNRYHARSFYFWTDISTPVQKVLNEYHELSLDSCIDATEQIPWFVYWLPNYYRFYVIETLKDWYREGDPTKKVPKLLVGLFGGIAGAASVLGNTPLDVVKTRMQSLDAARYKNTFDCAKYV